MDRRIMMIGLATAMAGCASSRSARPLMGDDIPAGAFSPWSDQSPYALFAGDELDIAFPSAQELNPLVRERIAIALRDQAGGSIRVQVGVNMFMPGATDDSTAADQLREQARRTVYKMAAHECDVILEVLAKECRLESINVNVNANRHYNNNVAPGYQVNGNIGLRVVLK